jgi:hypothetical protein
MPQKFISCLRDQALLLPPSLLDWVPEDHVVWTILGAVDELELDAFYGAYRADGRGRPAFEPSMMAWAQPVVATRCACDSKGPGDNCVGWAGGRLSSWRLARRAGRNGDSRARRSDTPSGRRSGSRQAWML